MLTVILSGNLGKDPETRFTPNGQKVTTFNVAVNQKKGKEEVTTWVRVTVWGDQFDKMISYLKKGSHVVVTGRLNPSAPYLDKEGRPQCSLEVTAYHIEFGSSGRTERQGDGQSFEQGVSKASWGTSQAARYEDGQFQMQGSNYGVQTGQGSSFSVEDDEIPF
jgi:single-strand DNA-binding protein